LEFLHYNWFRKFGKFGKFGIPNFSNFPKILRNFGIFNFSNFLKFFGNFGIFRLRAINRLRLAVCSSYYTGSLKKFIYLLDKSKLL